MLDICTELKLVPRRFYHFYPADGGSKILWSVCTFLPIYIMLYPSRWFLISLQCFEKLNN
jgi:hypothetical protein